MLFGGGVFGFVLLAFWLWAIFDVISTDESTVRNLPKLVWLLLVVFLSTIGALLWLVLGRPSARVGVGGGGGGSASPRATVVDDEEARRRRYAELDEELDRRLEERQRRERGED